MRHARLLGFLGHKAGKGDGVEERRLALAQLARLTQGVPPAHLMTGYLLAAEDRVRFTSNLPPDAELGMSFGIHRRLEIPMLPWQGTVRGVLVPDPLLWIEAAGMLGRASIWVRVSTDDSQLSKLLAGLVTSNRAVVERRGIETRIQGLREEVDRTLDIYGEVRRLMQASNAHQDADPNLPQFLRLAQEQMQALGDELSRLKQQLDPPT